MKLNRLKGVTHALASLSLTSVVVRVGLVSAVSLPKIVRLTQKAPHTASVRGKRYVPV